LRRKNEERRRRNRGGVKKKEEESMRRMRNVNCFFVRRSGHRGRFNRSRKIQMIRGVP
jgi:hypothetical protein